MSRNYLSKTGKRFILGFQGRTIPPFLEQFAEKFGLGGVIIYKRNFDSAENLGKLIAEITRQLHPDIIAVDQEGGEKSRISWIDIPSARELGEMGDQAKIYQEYNKVGKALADLGFNLNLAPVCELGTKGSYIYQRSFGQKAGYVAACVREAVRGLMDGGVNSCLKHFIGLTHTEIDPHQELPKSRFIPEELIPFKTGVDQGARFLMTTHIIIPGISPLPLTFSKECIAYIRRELGFKGEIITDDLMMGALSSYTLKERVARSLNAGYDRVLISVANDQISGIL